MSHHFTRQELYDLVWSEPMQSLAKKFDLSDVGLAKACKRVDIPRPPRGYWAKLKNGKKVVRQPLPPRGPGMFGHVEVGRGMERGWHSLTEKQILEAKAKPPVFDQGIADMAELVRKQVGHISVPRTFAKAHRLITRLLEADEERRQKQLSGDYILSWEKPIYDDPFERRRLRILNAIFIALERCNMKPSVRGHEARELDVKVNDQLVIFTLDATSQTQDPRHGASIRTRGRSDNLKLAITSWRAPNGIRSSRTDSDSVLLESQLDDIVAELIMAGEHQFREGEQGHFEWLIKRKAQVQKEIQERKLRRERQEREQRIRQEKARVDRLLDDAAALRQAADIRAYVDAVRDQRDLHGSVVPADQFEAWASWALAEADRIDPVRSGQFIESMKESKDFPDGEGENN